MADVAEENVAECAGGGLCFWFVDDGIFFDFSKGVFAAIGSVGLGDMDGMIIMIFPLFGALLVCIAVCIVCSAFRWKVLVLFGMVLV